MNKPQSSSGVRRKLAYDDIFTATHAKKTLSKIMNNKLSVWDL